MSFLLTGGSGLVGANLARLLCARGERPRLLLRERSERRALRGLSYEEAVGDILDPASLDRALRGVTHVFHVAGLVRQDVAGRDELRRVNVDGTRNVVEAARRAGVKRLVHVSSISAVGHGPLSAPATEDQPNNFDLASSPYHASKHEGEAVALAAEGLEVVGVNPTLVIGPYDSKPTSGEILLTVARGQMRFYPAGGNNFVNATDLAEGMWLAMEKGRPKERYILGGENLTYREFLTQCAEECGAPLPSLPAPEKLLRLAGKLADKLSPSYAWARNFSSSMVDSMFGPYYATSDKAVRELGYRFRPVRLGIRDAYAWFQEEGMIPRDQPLSPRGVVRS